MEKMTNTFQHCCKQMEHFANTPNDFIEYDNTIRSYFLVLYNDPRGTQQQMILCPWCSKQLPKALYEEWYDVLKKEYGVNSDDWIDWEEGLKSLPAEFQSDEWWRKRGL